jgi:hypothetical protein
MSISGLGASTAFSAGFAPFGRLRREEGAAVSAATTTTGATTKAGATTKEATTTPTSRAGEGEGRLSEQDQRTVERLRKRDAEVRQHEQAHMSAGGAHAGGASYEFQTGPDGKQYAVGGEVPIDLSREQDPQATISKMEVVKRAALAPADPSPQDLRVAQQAEQIRSEAQSELSRGDTKSAKGAKGAKEAEDSKGTENAKETENAKNAKSIKGGDVETPGETPTLAPVTARGAESPAGGGRASLEQADFSRATASFGMGGAAFQRATMAYRSAAAIGMGAGARSFGASGMVV